VLLLDNNRSELHNTAALLRMAGHDAGKDFETVECDLRDPNAVTSAATEAGRLFDGHLDCLINNAASTVAVIFPSSEHGLTGETLRY